MIFGVLFSLCLNAQENSDKLNWMPVPKNFTLGEGSFKLDKEFSVRISGPESGRLNEYATRFLRRLDQRTGTFFNQGFVPAETTEFIKGLTIEFASIGAVELGMDESYSLSISSEGLQLISKTDIGAMRGLETILQLLKNKSDEYFFPQIEVSDEPRFAWRGLMIDVSRHFQPFEVIKRNIDGLAAVKMNVLHLHLVDDHGFRVESKTHPKLHQLASDGEYFTQVQIKDIIKYAGDRGIRVVPEFDVPGHGSAFLTAYPELGSADQSYSLQRTSGIFDPTLDPTNDKTYEILGELFLEMAALFPDQYFHIGGDENEGHHWDQNKRIQKFMRKNDIKDNHGLQTYFNSRLLETLKSANKIMMGWDEILQPDLPKETVIHSWRGIESLHAAAKQGRKTVLSNGFYIDLLHPAKDHYLVDPLPEGHELTDEETANILGGEATQWSELVTPLTFDSRVWPRTAAIAERLWSPSEIKNVNYMYGRLAIIASQLEEHGLLHKASRNMILRNLTNGKESSSLMVLANVASPLEGYHRNPGGDLYKTFSPYTLFADLTIADPPLALKFNSLVDQYLNGNLNLEDEILTVLSEWSENHQNLRPIIESSPVLREIHDLSANFSELAAITKNSFEKEGFSGDSEAISWFKNAIDIVNNARQQGGRTELDVVDAMEKLIKRNKAIILAKKASGSIKIDGSLNDWSSTNWGYFTPMLHDEWSDTCYYALQWDANYLYLAFKVNNKNLQAEKSNRDEMGLHMDDGIEFLLDVANDKSTEWEQDDFAYHINILNAVLDDNGTDDDGNYNNSWNGNPTYFVKTFGTLNDPSDEDNGYHVEVSVSWKELGITPTEYLKIGVNLCVNDRDDITHQYRYFDYMNLNLFHQPSGFADLILVD